MSNIDKVHKRRRSMIMASDGLRNAVTSIGTSRDKHSASHYGTDYQLTRGELEDFYRNQWVAKAVDGIPFDMTREWRTFKGVDVDSDQIKMIENEEERLNLTLKTNDALTWGRLYGGAALILGVDGQGHMSEPLDITKVKKGQLKNIASVDRWMLSPIGIIDYNPLSPNFGQPEHWKLAWDPENNFIHHTRIVRFFGRRMPINISKENLFWGESVVQRMYQAMINNDTVSAAISSMVHEANIDAIKIDGLADTLMRKDGEEKVEKRLEELNYCKSILNMIALDGQEDIDRKAISFSALPEIQRIFLQIVAGASDYPIRRLIGEHQGGLNSGEEGSTRDYYDMVRSWQKAYLKPQLNYVDQVLVRSAIGDYPESLESEFNSLWQNTEKEQAEIDKLRADTLQVLVNVGVPEEVILLDGIEKGVINNMTVEDVEELYKELPAMPEEESEENAEETETD